MLLCQYGIVMFISQSLLGASTDILKERGNFCTNKYHPYERHRQQTTFSYFSFLPHPAWHCAKSHMFSFPFSTVSALFLYYSDSFRYFFYCIIRIWSLFYLIPPTRNYIRKYVWHYRMIYSNCRKIKSIKIVKGSIF